MLTARRRSRSLGEEVPGEGGGGGGQTPPAVNTMRTDNVSRPLEQIVRRLVEGLQPEQIILFGSHAYGEPKQGSDLDLVIVVAESAEPGHRRDQQAYRCLGPVGVPKDLVVFTREEFDRQARVTSWC